MKITTYELKEMGFSLKFVGKKLMDVSLQPASRKKLEEYIKNIDSSREKGVGLYIHSNGNLKQTGKTTLANIVGVSALIKGYTVQIVSFVELCDAFFQNERATVDLAYQEIIKKEFLVIDDLPTSLVEINKGNHQAFQTALLFRTRNLLPTIIVSVLTLSDDRNSGNTCLTIGQFFGDKIYTNIKELFQEIVCFPRTRI